MGRREELRLTAPLINFSRATYLQTISQHWLAYTIAVLSYGHKATSQNVNGTLVSQQQCAAQEICLCFDTPITDAFATCCKRWSVIMTEKAMSQFMAYIAALPIRVVRIIVDNGYLGSAWHGHG